MQVTGTQRLTGTTYASAFAYTAHGAVRQMTLGNGLVEQTSFNSRLQPTAIKLGTAAHPVDRLQLQYDYGTTANNGNLLSQTITVPGLTPPLIQNYEYDALNRLSQARETSTGVQSWQQVYGYDRFGNRSFASGTSIPAVLNSQTNPGFNQTQDNRINGGQGYAYDAAGNVTIAPGYTYEYDAENRLVRAWDGQPNPNRYSYDGDGRRVKKVSGNGQETSIFVYNAMGQMVAEYNDQAPATANETSYLTMDTLGTPRMITKADGSVRSRYDYLPFGEKISAGIGGRTTAQGYGGSDNVRQKFTGSERDDETGLDYMQARYYSNAQGRFTNPDSIGGSIQNPQTLNLYAYVQNDPLNYNDPTGHTSRPTDFTPCMLRGGMGCNGEAMVQTQEGAKPTPKPKPEPKPDTPLLGDGDGVIVINHNQKADSSITVKDDEGSFTVSGSSRGANTIAALFIATARTFRAPDAIQFSWGGMFFGQTYTLDAHGNFYATPFDFYLRKPIQDGKFPSRLPNFRFGVSLMPVWIAQRRAPTDRESRNVFAGVSMTGQVGYFGGIGISYSPSSDSWVIGGGLASPGGGFVVGNSNFSEHTGWGWR